MSASILDWWRKYRSMNRTSSGLSFPNLARTRRIHGKRVARVDDDFGPIYQLPVIHAFMRRGNDHGVETTEFCLAPSNGLSARPMPMLARRRDDRDEWIEILDFRP